MKFAYKFQNICGSVYKQGNVAFTPDGGSILSPVGNRISMFNLIDNSSCTLPFENSSDIRTICLSPDASLLISVSHDGRALLVNFQQRIVLSHFNFKAKVDCIRFSPDGRYFAATHGNQVQVWKTPSMHKEFAPFVLHRTYTGHYEDIRCIDWSSDSQFFITGSKDLSIRQYSVNPIKGYIVPTLTGHRDPVVACFYAKSDRVLYSVSAGSALFIWGWTPTVYDTEQEGDEQPQQPLQQEQQSLAYGTWSIKKKHYFQQDNAKIRCAALHKANQLLVLGFTNGVFGLYDVNQDETGEFLINNLHSLSISQSRISTVAINPTGDWLAFGVARQGQLLVWELQSETYILKQQGHFHDMNCLAYSPDGQIIATGDDYGKVKLWNTTSGFCFVTFGDHTAPITDVVFSPQGASVFSSSLDGSVRAFDLVRYRNFRTFLPPQSAQYTCVAVDSSGEVVCAGTMDPYEIHLWSVQTGRLLDVLTGHEGPISALTFSPTSTLLASGSWDRTVRLWDVYAKRVPTEVLHHPSDVLAIAFRPDGKQLAVTSLNGQIHFWEPSTGSHMGTIEGKNDIMGGRSITDTRTAKTTAQGKTFTSVCYSADGQCVLAGGDSKYICIYEVSERLLIRKFQISHNRSFDGVSDFLNSKSMSDAGPLELIEPDYGSDDELTDLRLPGVKSGPFSNLSSRSTPKTIRSKSVRFSPTGRAWAAVTVEGLLIYCLDPTLFFDPFLLDIDITPSSVREKLTEGHYLLALLMSFRLNEKELISEVFHSTPAGQIQLVVKDLPTAYVTKLLTFISETMAKSKHMEFCLLWLLHTFNHHGDYLKDNSSSLMSLLRDLQKNCSVHYDALAPICDDNTYTLDYVSTFTSFKDRKATTEEPAIVDKMETIQTAPPAEKKSKRKRKASVGAK